MLINNTTYSHIALKTFIVVIFILSTLVYGCSSEKTALLFWEGEYYYNIEDARRAVGNSADKTLDTVTGLSTPVFKSNLLIIVPLQEMAVWAKEKKHAGNTAIGIILEEGLHMYASAVKKHNMFKEVVIISSENRTTDRTLFDYILHVKGLDPGTDRPMWAINKTGHNIDMPFQSAIEDLFVSDSLNKAVNNLKSTINKIDEILSSINEHETIKKFLKGKER
jgi:hypothetical protein